MLGKLNDKLRWKHRWFYSYRIRGSFSHIVWDWVNWSVTPLRITISGGDE